MIQIQLFDSSRNELHLNDVVLVHYTNPKIKYLGIVHFDERDKGFVISDGHTGYEVFNKSMSQKIERIGHIKDMPHLARELGRFEGKQFIKSLEELLDRKFI